jgi:hypothetical protein
MSKPLSAASEFVFATGQHYPTFFAFYVGESDDLFRGENE